jgi:hypothetical protein
MALGKVHAIRKKKEQKSNPILKEFSDKSSDKYITND